MSEIIDTTFLKSICEELARDLNYQPEKPIREDNISYRALQKEFAQYNTAKQWFHNICLTAATMAELPYPGLSEEIRYYVAKYTWLALYVDDMEHSHAQPERISSFQRSIIDVTAAEPEGELLQALRKHLAESYRLFEPMAADGIVLCAMDFIHGSLLEQMSKVQRMRLTNASASWPYYLRRKAGSSIGYGFMLFPKEANVDISVYIQVIDDMTLVTDLTNDQNYVYNRAAVTQRSIKDTLNDLAEESIQANSRITQVLESSANTTALKIWRNFVNGYIGFHFTLDRYRLQELVDYSALSTYSKSGSLRE
ncbi:terpenoid synthase [Agrocybe pediades]|nr:terpenoid synthase [Agrocybe pediades]